MSEEYEIHEDGIETAAAKSVAAVILTMESEEDCGNEATIQIASDENGPPLYEITIKRVRLN